MSKLRWFAFAFAGLICLSSSASAESQLDKLLNEENKAKNVSPAATVDDLTFLRRLSIDMIGRIPTLAEINEFEAWAPAERRQKLVDKLLKQPGFADRWTVFLADLFRIRSNADGGAAELAYVHKAVEEGTPYDVLCRELITASGKAGSIPQVGFVLGDNADPMALAGTAAQVFMGTRIACAQCHDHPFDVWSREQFYGMAAFFGKTARRESEFTKSVYAYEMKGSDSKVKWPPEGLAPDAQRKAMIPSFPFDLKLDKPAPQHEVRLVAMRKAEEDAKAAAAAGKSNSVDELLSVASTKVESGFKKPETFDVAGDAKRAAIALNVKGDLLSQSELRNELGRLITHPRNKLFSQALVNRAWAELMGRGFVEPVDDFSVNNPPSHEKTLTYLADEFVAGGYDLRKLVTMIVLSDAYSRGHSYTNDEVARRAAEESFAATPVRRMLAETMFDSVVSAGHLFAPKHAEGDNLKTIKEIVQVAVDLEGKPTAGSILTQVQGGKGAGMNGGMAGPGMASGGAASGYDLESAIEVDFKQVLAMAAKDKGDEPKVEMMMVSPEDAEARMVAEEQGRRKKYVDKVVERVIDDNPVFASSMRMPSPAPPAHFLRIFGQPARDTLGDHRDHSASMRQALMMLNGKMTHEASRVGKLEPIYPLLVGKKADVDAAVRMAYREILTREPAADELADARELVTASASPADGMADLRWILFNCHEFRFIP